MPHRFVQLITMLSVTAGVVAAIPQAVGVTQETAAGPFVVIAEAIELPSPSAALDATPVESPKDNQEDGQPGGGESADRLPEDEKLSAGESQLTDDALTVGADVTLLPRWNNGLGIPVYEQRVPRACRWPWPTRHHRLYGRPRSSEPAGRRRPESTACRSDQLAAGPNSDRRPDV